MKHVLEADSVQKFFNHKLVVSDVYLKCETGDIIGLLGRNGSGKSTLLKIIFGMVPADYKFVRIDGKLQVKTSELLKEIGYLPQDNFIPKHFSVAKTIQLSISKEKRNVFCDDSMIQSMLNKKISHLSGGELRYLEIKLILFNDSKFVLLDEPYNGLAPVMVENINALIRENAKSKGIIITDHNYRNVIEVSTKLILMVAGKTHHLKDTNELIERGYLKEGML
ncbi:ABC transporter [Flavobacterium cauense R2A-7]|uniref:ABC-type lipopolysaccharide export system ATPase subunit n=1 Tax=Flavobacterium cauense R2A-7 TaxID=1341154 RepID=V6S598_9FLAO|nr:ATP-binding cassette domain-containing protein [Flavobacterium cauense]ESU21858.1 ABC transporter [Flavobacterium cauense R2A-7]KGO81088.1 ABC transporter [Flavobacterium cauense R2A-7]TWI13004.1 ABC-type lipopolysaccharide export system ATPase subunit [Flavobacterium cauense R2A-7]